MAGGLRYAGFISSGSADEALAAWLQRSLEAYRTPAPLVGREGPGGPIGARLGVFFRDCGDAGGRDLEGDVRSALDRSDAMIVLRPAGSRPRERASDQARYFKSLGRGARIITAMVEGEPGAAASPFVWRKLVEDEPQPHASAYHADEDPVLADFRGGPSERNAAKSRIIAELLGVSVEALAEAEGAALGTRVRRLATAGAAVVVVSLSAGGVAWLVGNLAQQLPASIAQAPEPLRTAQLEEPPAPLMERPAMPVQSPPRVEPAAPAAPPPVAATAPPPPIVPPPAVAPPAVARPASPPLAAPARTATPVAPPRQSRPAAQPPAPPRTQQSAASTPSAPRPQSTPAPAADPAPPRADPPAATRVAAGAETVRASSQETRSPESLLQQVRELGAAQAVAVRCQGRSNQVNRDLARYLISSSPEARRGALSRAFNEGYQAAEARADACPGSGAS